MPAPTRKMVSFTRFAKFTPPTRYTGPARRCSLTPTPSLNHSHNTIAVGECVSTDTGARRLLCAACLTYVQAFQWAAQQSQPIKSELQLKTLAMVWDAPQGFVVPPARMFGAGYTGNHVAHHLKAFVRSGLMRKADDRYVLRDACPACYRRGGCAKECGMHFEPEHFAMRRESYVTG